MVGLRGLHYVLVRVRSGVLPVLAANRRATTSGDIRCGRELGTLRAIHAALALQARLCRGRSGASSGDDLHRIGQTFVGLGDDRAAADFSRTDLGIETRADLDPRVRLGAAKFEADRDRP